MVRVLDAADEQEDVLDRVYEVMVRCHTEVSEDAPYRTRAEAVAFMRHSPEFETREYWIAESEGHCVGFAQLAVGSALPTARVDILVHPDSRRSGHGTACWMPTIPRDASARTCPIVDTYPDDTDPEGPHNRHLRLRRRRRHPG